MTDQYSFEKTALHLESSSLPEHCDAQDVAAELFFSWQNHDGEKAPGRTPLEARIRENRRGASNVRVFEVSFETRQNEVARFVLRQHLTKEASVRCAAEAEIANRLDSEGNADIACKVAGTLQSLPNTIIYRHVGSNYQLLSDLVADTAGGFEPLEDAAREWARSVARVYDATSEATRVQNATEYVSAVSNELPPDLIIDARSLVCTVREKTVFLSRKHYPQAEPSYDSITIAELARAARNRALSDYDKISISVQLRANLTSRYAKASRVQGKHLHTEVWILLDESQLADFASLHGASVVVSLTVADVRIRTAHQALVDRGFKDSSIIDRKYLFESAMRLDRDGGARFRLRNRHRDLHVGNVLVSQSNLRMIDLGDNGLDLLGTDIARLKVSVVHSLCKSGRHVEDLNQFLAALQEGFLEGMDPKPDKLELLFAVLVQAGFYQRYALEEEGSEVDTEQESRFAEHCLKWVAELTRYFIDKAGSESRIEDSSPAESRYTLGDLWRDAIQGGEYGLAEPLIGALAEKDETWFEKPLTRFQQRFAEEGQRAGSIFNRLDHVLLSGPTSSGKSTVAEMFLVRPSVCNKHRRISLYIAPTRALAQAKYHDLVARFAGTSLASEIVLSTGEDTEYDHRILTGSFRIACLVYEKANVLFSRNDKALRELACVVVDEMHMLAEFQRGPLLEVAVTKALHERRRADRQTIRGDNSEAPRIVGISTEPPDGPLRDFLSVLDADTGDSRPPTVVYSEERPVIVEHGVVLPGVAGADKFEYWPICEMGARETRALTEQEHERVGARVRAYRELEGEARGGEARQTGSIDYLPLLEALIQRRAINEANGNPYRMLVFVPARHQLEELGEALRISVAKKSRPVGNIRALEDELDSQDEYDTEHRVSLCARRGILLHHAEVPTRARREIERICANPPQHGQFEILLATETLKFGVNLFVTDVVLLGVEFITSLRSQETIRCHLTACDFHNMLGRAGRLGLTGSLRGRAMTIVSSVEDVMPQLVRPYYCEGSPLASALFMKEDKDVIFRHREEMRASDGLGRALTARMPSGRDFTQPFVRAILDTLRHENVISAKLERAKDAKRKETHIHVFLYRTLFAFQNFPQNGEGREGKKGRTLDLFRTAVSAVLTDLSSNDLALIERSTRGGSAGPRRDGVDEAYSITALGEAIIDTGTEIGTIAPLVTAQRKLRDVWVQGNFDGRFPTALYVLCVVAQEEIFRQVVESVPETVEHEAAGWSDERAATNRTSVRAKFAESLRAEWEGDAERLADDVVAAMSEFEWLNDRTDIVQAYEGGLVDGVLRLFNSIVSWSRGARAGEVKRAIVTDDVSGGQVSRLSGFLGFKDQVSWKLVFLSRLLGASGLSDDWVRVEFELYSWATRVRSGLTDDAAILISQREKPHIRRREAIDLVNSGVTMTTILRGDLDGSDEKVPGRLLDQLRGRLEAVARDQFKSLCDGWTAREGGGEYVRVREAWQRLTADFSGMIGDFRGEAYGSEVIASAFGDLNGGGDDADDFREPLQKAGDEDTGLEDEWGTMRSRWAGKALIWTLESSGDKSSKRLYIAPYQMRSDWNVRVDSGWVPAHEALDGLTDVGCVMVVGFPWWPNSASMTSGLRKWISSRTAEGRVTVLCSPAALMITWVAITRRYLEPTEFFGFLAEGTAELRTYGLVDARRLLFDGRHGRTIVPPLRELVLNHLEVGI